MWDVFPSQRGTYLSGSLQVRQLVAQLVGTSTTPPTLPPVQLRDADGVNAIEITFNRSVVLGGIVPKGQPQSIEVTFNPGPAAGPMRVNGNVEFKANTNDTVVNFIANKPAVFGAGSYTLTVFGSDQANVGSAIKAQADGAALDGDFNGKPGGDFVLPFEVSVTNT